MLEKIKTLLLVFNTIGLITLIIMLNKVNQKSVAKSKLAQLPQEETKVVMPKLDNSSISESESPMPSNSSLVPNTDLIVLNSDNEQFEAAQIQRRRLINEICSDTSNRRKLIKLQRLYEKSMHDKVIAFTAIWQHKLLSCNPSKVGSTTLTSMYMQLNKGKGWHPQHGDIHTRWHKMQSHSMNKDDKRKLLKLLKANQTQDYLTFMSFRHPLERLYSAYWDRVATKINRIRRVETFAQFIAHVGSSKVYNTHWSPIVVTCDPCQYQFKYFLQMETFTRDLEQISEKLDLDFKVSYEAKNSHGDQRSKTNKDYEIWLEDVNAESLQNFLSRFEMDFRLFGYDLEFFLKLLDKKRIN